MNCDDCPHHQLDLVKIANRDAENAKLKDALAWEQVSRQIESEARKAGVPDYALPDVLARAKLDGTQWVKDSKRGWHRQNSARLPDFNDRGETITPATFIRDLSKDASASHIFCDAAPAVPTVGVSTPSPSVRQSMPTGPNPFAKETRNLTKQGEIYKKSPELAKQMATAAGVDLKI